MYNIMYVFTYVQCRVCVYANIMYNVMYVFTYNVMHTIMNFMKPFNAHNHLYNIIYDATDNKYID